MRGVLANKRQKVLFMHDKVIALKPYLKTWGYTQSKNEGATVMYDWVFKCLQDGFSVEERIIDGKTYVVDGGPAPEEYEGFRKIIVPIPQFKLSGNEYMTIWDCLDRVARYNQELCYHVKGQEFLDEDGNNARQSGKMIVSVTMFVPNDTQRKHMQIKMKEAVAQITEKVVEICGVSVGDKLTKIQKWSVTKVIHDWIMERTYYNLNHEAIKDTAAYYLTQLAYSALTDEADVKPICAGYTAAMAYLCNMYRINCVFVSGFAVDDTVTKPTDHAWNIVSFTLPYGEYSSDPSQWAAMDLTWDDKRLDEIKQGTPWEYFCTDKVYHEHGDSEITRTLDDRGYPFGDYETTIAPTATYPYTGNTLFDITNEIQG